VTDYLCHRLDAPRIPRAALRHYGAGANPRPAMLLTPHRLFIPLAGYELHYHPNVPVSFGFLFACLLGSVAAVAGSDFRITRAWGGCLIVLYVLFMAVSVLVEMDWIQLARLR
jgi:hypothetical protein